MTVVDISNKKGPAGVVPAEPLEIDEAAIESIRHRIKEHQTDQGYSHGQLAAKIGVGKSSYALFVSGKYPSDTQLIAGKIASYLEHDAQRAAIGGAPEFVRTSVAQEIDNALTTAEILPGFAIIACGAGLGKSRTCAEFRERRRKSGKPPVYVSVAQDCERMIALLSELMYAMAHSENRRFMGSRAQLIRRDVVRMLAGRPLMIDEAQYLEQAGLDELRCIADQSGSPLMLVGNEQIYEGGSHQGSPAFAQFSSRVVSRVFISAKDITEADVKMIALQLAPRPIVIQCLDLLVTEARNEGAFRTVEKVLKLAKLHADANNEPLDRPHVVAAIAKLRNARRNGRSS